MLAIAHSVGVITTTMQAQDFKDVIGDRLVGRKTMPIMYEAPARLSMLGTLMIWSLTLSLVWRVHITFAAVFNLLGLLVGLRFIRFSGMKEDLISFWLYTVRIFCR